MRLLKWGMIGGVLALMYYGVTFYICFYLLPHDSMGFGALGLFLVLNIWLYFLGALLGHMLVWSFIVAQFAFGFALGVILKLILRK